MPNQKNGLFALSPQILRRKQNETGDSLVLNFDVEERDTQGSERRIVQGSKLEGNAEKPTAGYGSAKSIEATPNKYSEEYRDDRPANTVFKKASTSLKNEVDTGIPTEKEEMDMEMVIPTEGRPLIAKTGSTPTSKGTSSLWKKLREKSDSLVFNESQSLAHGFDLEGDAETRKIQHSKRITSEIRDVIEFSLSQCLLAILVYLVVAVVAYSFVFEQWSIIDSIYFACVVFTTIGYGDLVPSSDSSRLFTASFALSGVACLGVALGVLGSNLIEAQEETVERARRVSQYQVMTLFDSSPKANAVNEEEATKKDECKKDAPWFRSNFVLHVLPIFGLLFACCGLLGISSGWNFVSTFYFCIISASTVGFGDFSPQSQIERLVVAFFIPVAVGAMGQWLSVAANYIIEKRQRKFRKAFEARELTIHDLEVMDDDGDGKVTFAEYLEFMLVAMNKVDKDLLQDLRAQFDHLDVDGTGTLEKEDLVVAAKRKLKSTKRKLELAQYKQELLSAGKKRGEKKQSLFGLVHSLLPN